MDNIDKGTEDDGNDDNVKVVNQDGLVMIFDQNNNTCYAIQKLENKGDGLNNEPEWMSDGDTVDVDEYVVADDQSIDSDASPSFSSATLTDKDSGLFDDTYKEACTIEGEKIYKQVAKETGFTAADIKINQENCQIINGVEYLTSKETKDNNLGVGWDGYGGLHQPQPLEACFHERY